MHEFEADPPIQQEVVEALTAAAESLSVAESLTGGLVGALLTEVPGASDVVDRALVTYTHEAKREELAVEQEILDEIGAVTELVAEQMARGVRNVSGTTWGLSTTGVAGPPDGHHDRPVGTVYVGVVRGSVGGYDGVDITTQRYDFDGSRNEIREKAARQALDDLHAEIDV